MSDPPAPPRSMRSMQRQQVRGSSLLLVGRVLAVGVNFLTQVILVRSLSKGEFGVFAFGLSIVNLAETMITLGFDRGVTRFLPIYDERGDRGRFVGTLLFVPSAVLTLGVVVVLAVIALRGTLAGTLDAGSGAASILMILAFLAPVQAIDNLMLGLFAVFSRARAIFFRRYVLAPGLRLLVVVIVASADGEPTALALGYVIAGAFGVALYATFFVQSLRRSGALGTGGAPIEVPVREILLFTLPLLSSDLVFVLLDSVDALLLGAFRGADDVAALRAVQPVARMNLLVLNSFGVLFTPLAARLFARDAFDDIRELYWRTAVWVAVITFPAAAVTIGASRSLTVALFGERYESSAFLLSLLAIGYYVSASFGFNGLTLNVLGLVKVVVAVNVAAAVLNVALNLALIPLLGARGAAIATATTLVAHNVLRQMALARRSAVPAFERAHAPVYAQIAIALAVLAVVDAVVSPPLPVALALGGVATIAVVGSARDRLQLGETFPELARLPIVGRYLGGSR